MSATKWLVIGPGAMAFYAFLGQMSMMDLSQVRAVSGSSAGALLALLWIIYDGNIPEMLDFALKVRVAQLMKPNIKNFLNNFGMVPMNKMRRAISDAIFRKFKTKEITFGELWNRRPIGLHVSAFCTERGQTVYFSRETHPGASVVDAVCASIAVPFLFSAVKIDDWRYVDGGFQENIPGLPFLTKPRHEVTAIRIAPPPPGAPSLSLSSYIGNIFAGILRLRHTYEYQSFVIESDDIDIFDFSADGLQIFTLGQKSRNLVNEAHYQIRVCDEPRREEDHGQGDGGSQVLHLHAQAGVHARETGARLRRGGDRQGPQADRQVEEGYANVLRISPSRGQDESPQVSEQGD
jgi:predicted acylesterase/phospholipase RssA